jgi:hypothetical protein
MVYKLVQRLLHAVVHWLVHCVILDLGKKLVNSSVHMHFISP